MDRIKNKCDFKSRKYLMISGEKLIKASTDSIWNTIIQNQQLTYFNPFIKNQSSGVISGVGYKDTSQYYSGINFQREVIKFSEKEHIKFQFKLDNKDHIGFSFFEIKSSNLNGYTLFRLTVETNAYRNVPRPIWHLVAYFFVVPMFYKYINSVVNGLEHYLLTGEKVKKNQFGKHIKFS